jgi:hypothetical protein
MRKLVRSLLITAAATGAAALVLNAMDLDAPPETEEPDFPGFEPDDFGEEDLGMLMKELASQL